MKRISLLFSVLVVCFVAAMQAQAPTPKPDPALQQLRPWVGYWTFECDYKPGPLGPGGKVTGEWASQMILGGFFAQNRWAQKGPAGELRGIDIVGYDPVDKNFTFTGFQSNGTTSSWTFTISGNTVTDAGKFFFNGKQYLGRVTETYTADWASGVWKGEISTDGKTWVPWFEWKMTKVKPAAKK